MYIKENLLMKELIISKGKGLLTKEAETMLILLCDKSFIRMINRYKNKDDEHDIKMGGVEAVFKNWRSFNPDKFDKALPYFTEVFKRGLVKSNYLITHWANYDRSFLKIIRFGEESEGVFY